MDTCKNCGGWKGLHKWDTMQCPRGGVEAPVGKPDMWMTSTFEDDSPSAQDKRIDDLEEKIKLLRTQVDDLLEALPSANRNIVP